MLQELSTSYNYLLVSLTCFLFLPTGRYFGFKGLFTPSIVGLMICAIPVAIFANFCAILIKPTIYFLIAINIYFLATNLNKNRLTKTFNFGVLAYIFFIVTSIITYLSSFPANSKQMNLQYLESLKVTEI